MRHLVDDEHVAAGSAQNVLVDASFDEPLEEALVAAPDDDQVDVALLRETDDGVGRRALRGDEISAEAASLEVGPRLLEPLLGQALRVWRPILRWHNVRDDQRRAELLRVVGGAPQCLALGVVVGDEDRVHWHGLEGYPARPDATPARHGVVARIPAAH
jgi:hypothetical protein